MLKLIYLRFCRYYNRQYCLNINLIPVNTLNKSMNYL